MTDAATATEAAATDDVVLVERRGSVLLITLNRPGARNAINAEVARRLGAAVEELSSDPELRVAVLRGAGPAFCAGQDLKALTAGESLLPAEHPEWGFAGFVRHFTPKPIIAAIHGFAFGGGLELALACDLIVAASGTRLALPEVTRGLFAAGGGVPRIAQQLPMKVAMQLALTGAPMTAEAAERWGLVNAVVPEDELETAALALAESIAANAPLSIQVTKRLISDQVQNSTWEQRTWDPIQEGLETIFSSEDADEGARAFVEKRPPVWRGR